MSDWSWIGRYVQALTAGLGGGLGENWANAESFQGSVGRGELPRSRKTNIARWGTGSPSTRN